MNVDTAKRIGAIMVTCVLGFLWGFLIPLLAFSVATEVHSSEPVFHEPLGTSELRLDVLPTPTPAVVEQVVKQATFDIAAVQNVLKQAERKPGMVVSSRQVTTYEVRQVCEKGRCRMVSVPVTKTVQTKAKSKRKPPVGGFTIGALPVRSQAEQVIAAARSMLGTSGTFKHSWSRTGGKRRIELAGGLAITLPETLQLTYQLKGNQLVATFGTSRPAVVMAGIIPISVEVWQFTLGADAANVGLSWCPDLKIKLE